MPKQAVSVTLEIDNLRWLQGQAAATKSRGVSDTLDRLVTSARLGGQVHDHSVRSVVNTIEINHDDPDLTRADDHVRGLVAVSTARPFIAREASPRASRPAGTGRTPKGARRG